MSEKATTLDDVRDAIVFAALPHVPFDGWTWKTLRAAAVATDFDASMAERAFASPIAAVAHFADLADRQLLADAEEATLDTLGMTARIAWLVRRRIEPWAGERETVRRALSLLCLPGNAGTAIRVNWRTADVLWRAAGDQTVDFNYYTKRATLSAIFAATLLFWLDDESEDNEATWDFLSRELAALKWLPKAKAAILRRTEAWRNPLAGLRTSASSR